MTMCPIENMLQNKKRAMLEARLERLKELYDWDVSLATGFAGA